MMFATSLEPFLAHLVKDSFVRRPLLYALTVHGAHVLMIDWEAFAGLAMTKSLLACLTLLSVVILLAQVKVSCSIILLVSCLILLVAASRRWLRAWWSFSSWSFVKLLCHESFLWVHRCLITLWVSSASDTLLINWWWPCGVRESGMGSWVCDRFLMWACLSGFSLVSAQMVISRLDRWVVLFASFVWIASWVRFFFLRTFLF